MCKKMCNHHHPSTLYYSQGLGSATSFTGSKMMCNVVYYLFVTLKYNFSIFNADSSSEQEMRLFRSRKTVPTVLTV